MFLKGPNIIIRAALLALLIGVVSLLLLSCQALGVEGEKTRIKSVVLEATEDVYLTTDAAATEDPQGLRDKNFGSQDFVKVWYAWKVVGEEKVVSIGLFKFDLGPIREREVLSAHLQLFALRADLASPARLVDVHLVNGAWSEQEVTFNSRPAWDVNPIATGVVYGAGVWYSWDVTGSLVGKAKEGVVSYAVGLRALEEKKEEQAVFAAREVGRNGPRLLVTYRVPPPSVPWYIWAAGMGVVAVLAFLVGWWLPRRRRPA